MLSGACGYAVMLMRICAVILILVCSPEHAGMLSCSFSYDVLLMLVKRPCSCSYAVMLTREHMRMLSGAYALGSIRFSETVANTK